MLNKEQINKIDNLLDSARSGRFLTKSLLKKIIDELGLPIKINKTHLLWKNCKRKKMDYIFADEAFSIKKWGLWEPAFWLWLFRRLQIIQIHRYAILIDFDPATLLYCHQKWKQYKKLTFDKS